MRDAMTLDPIRPPGSVAGMTAVRGDPLMIVTAVALALGLANRLLGGLDTPLWFDETFTAVIASQPSVTRWLHWCLNELSGPVYYGLVFLWEKIAGNGDLALRLPGLAASVATPLLILWRGHPDRNVRLLWASAVALWLPGFYIATEARPYGLLFLLCTLQAIAYLRLMERPGVRIATLWAGLCALAVLTHYHAAVICGLQGLLYLAIHRRAAIRTWPALLALVPMVAWMAFHLPFVLSFAKPNVVWYAALPPSAIWLAPALILGPILPATLLLALMALTWIAQAIVALRRQIPWPYSSGESALIASGVIGFTLVFGLGFIQPSFAPRYVLPAMPALLFAIALWVARMEARIRYAGPLLVALMIGWSIGVLSQRLTNPTDDRRYGFNLENPSAWMAERGVRRLIFFWDNPTSSIGDPHPMGEVGGFFLARSGHPVPVEVPAWHAEGPDPNLMLKARAAAPKTALLWIYDVNVPGTLGIRHPHRIAHDDPRWACRDFGRGDIVVLACMKR